MFAPHGLCCSIACQLVHYCGVRKGYTNDYMARKRSHNMIEAIEEKYVNARPAITELGEQPFATLGFRKLEDTSKPISKKKEEELPF